jgi:hypothetical protein
MVKGKDNLLVPDGKIQNPSVMVLITWRGLQAFSLMINAKAGDPVGGYGGVYSDRVGKDTHLKYFVFITAQVILPNNPIESHHAKLYICFYLYLKAYVEACHSRTWFHEFSHI